MRAYERFVVRLERVCLRRSPLATVESKFAVAYLNHRYPNLRIQQAEHAPNRVFLSVSRRPQIQPLHFISIGTLAHHKGTDLLFHALDQLTPQMPFQLTVICGPKPAYLQQLRATISPALWQRIQFRHNLLPHEVAREMETPTMLLLPSRVDNSPNAVKEAVVAGVPVVASDVGGIPDYVTPGKNGFLFPPGDLAGFVDAIKAACAHPLFGQGRVDAKTLSQTRDYLSPERMAENFLRAYHAALA
jgi:glycosyltransferase involved in cell wall biosynthesis